MPPLPNGHLAVVSDAKLSDYCLSDTHWEGLHKARVFRSVLGLARADAPLLKEWLLHAAATEEATFVDSDAFGDRWQIDFAAEYGERRATVRSAWLLAHSEPAPRFVTCYILI